jgi:hypothetical protein
MPFFLTEQCVSSLVGLKLTNETVQYRGGPGGRGGELSREHVSRTRDYKVHTRTGGYACGSIEILQRLVDSGRKQTSTALRRRPRMRGLRAYLLTTVAVLPVYLAVRRHLAAPHLKLQHFCPQTIAMCSGGCGASSFDGPRARGPGHYSCLLAVRPQPSQTSTASVFRRHKLEFTLTNTTSGTQCRTHYPHVAKRIECNSGQRTQCAISDEIVSRRVGSPTDDTARSRVCNAQPGQSGA